MYVGSRHLHIEDQLKEISFPTLVMYPTDVPSTPTAFGPYSIDVSPNAPISAGKCPLVVVSHGNSGSHLVYRTICTHLAKHGYVVAMLEHPGNNHKNNELEGTYDNLVNRPRHVRLTIDAVLSEAFFSSSIQADTVAVVGHSIGGYTALAVAGGTPWTKEQRRVEVVADSRVRALVLLAPATAWYLTEGSLSKVTVPILMLIAEHDPYAPPWHADIVLNGVADRNLITWKVVENAGHFSFLSPFPASMKRPGFLPSTDPEGFDRDKYHAVLPGEVREYLDSKLKHPADRAGGA